MISSRFRLLAFHNLWIVYYFSATIDAFTTVPRPNLARPTRPNLSFSRMVSADPDQQQDLLPIESMRVKEIQTELKERKVSYTDCFDKESLVKRLQEARETTTLGGDDNNTSTDEEEVVAEVMGKGDYVGKPDDTTIPKKEFDKEAKLAELRAMKVRELREACAKRNIRWANMIEKEDLVQALIEVIERQVDFSVSGVIQPGQVADLTADQLELELSAPSDAPLLLDVSCDSDNGVVLLPAVCVLFSYYTLC